MACSWVIASDSRRRLGAVGILGWALLGAGSAGSSPTILSFDVGVSGTMPAAVTRVQVGDITVTPVNGSYTAQVVLPLGQREASILVQGWDADGVMVSTRRVAITLSNLPTVSN